MAKESIGLVTDEASEISDEWAKENQVEIVKAEVNWPYFNIEEIPGENIFDKMREADKQGKKVVVKTALSNLAGFKKAFETQLEKYDKVLYIAVSHKFSGAINGAFQMRNLLKEKERIFIFDSFSGTSGEGLFVLRAKELIDQGMEINDILNELNKLKPKVKVIAFFQDPKWVVASGRVSKTAGEWIRRIKKWGFQPIIRIRDGQATSGGIVKAQDEISAILKIMERFKKRSQKKLRAFISHGGIENQAQKLKKELEELEIEVPMVTMASLVVAGHTGPGTMICGWHELD